MTRLKRLALLSALGAGAVLALMAVYRALFPAPTDTLQWFVVDARTARGEPLRVEQLFTRDDERRTTLRVEMTLIQPAQILPTAEALLSAFAGVKRQLQAAGRWPAQGSGLEAAPPRVLPVFVVELRTPVSESKKQLREQLDRQVQFRGEDRHLLLRSTAPLIRPDLYTMADACKSLRDDLAYMRWNFGGTGLELNEAGIKRLRECRPLLGHLAFARASSSCMCLMK